MYSASDSRSSQENGKAKPISQRGQTRILGNGEVFRRFKQYSLKGRHDEGPMSPTEALEEAIEDVFGGGTRRGQRRFRALATEKSVERMKQLRQGKGESVEEYLGDPTSVRQRVRETSDPSVLARLLVAEYACRNESAEARPAVIAIIQSKLGRLGDKAAKGDGADGTASDEELAAALSEEP